MAPNTFTTGKYVGIIGDFSRYEIVDALDMTVEVGGPALHRDQPDGLHRPC